MDAAGRAPVGSAAIFAAEARLPVLTDFPPRRASFAAERERTSGRPGVGTSRGEHRPRAVGPQHDEFVVARGGGHHASRGVGGRASLHRPRRLHRSAAVFAAVRAVQRGDAGVVAFTPEGGFRRDHQHAPRAALANRARALHHSRRGRGRFGFGFGFGFCRGRRGARGSDAASSRASAPNQRTEPAPSTARTPPPSTAPEGTSAERPSGRRVDPPTTALSRDARGSASVQDTSAGSPEPGGASAAKYRPQTGSYVAGDAKV